MTNPCDFFREHLKAYQDRQTSLVLRGRLRMHVSRCAACREELATMRQMSEALQDRDTGGLDPVLRARILASIPDAPPPAPTNRTRSSLRPRPVLLYVGSAAVVGTLLGAFFLPAYLHGPLALKDSPVEASVTPGAAQEKRFLQAPASPGQRYQKEWKQDTKNEAMSGAGLAPAAKSADSAAVKVAAPVPVMQANPPGRGALPPAENADREQQRMDAIIREEIPPALDAKEGSADKILRRKADTGTNFPGEVRGQAGGSMASKSSVSEKDALDKAKENKKSRNARLNKKTENANRTVRTLPKPVVSTQAPGAGKPQEKAPPPQNASQQSKSP